MKYTLLITFTILLLNGCHSPAPFSKETTQSLVLTKSLKPIEIQTSTYTLKAWTPAKPKSQRLRIYIEGDGRAWLKRGIASSDPTPANRLVHSLMLEDPYSDVAYLGRPCQYIMSDSCNKAVWTFGRYDSKSLDSLNESIDFLKKDGQYKEIELVGYSGGATLALLTASRRDDVITIRTLAGNLDPAFTNRLHNVTPMPSAMNPLNFQDSLNTIPQLHFYGSKDRIIPSQISKHYLKSASIKECISLKKVEGATHSKGWNEKWKQLISISPECRIKEKKQ
ncbi:hypothetical protein [Endozoicomonas arenosclerae]|uniref:hypothetical protein n=1 Tax=Endozoicomonas arenosclerae TaxID=1633495 RepID=UPI0007826C11|nr:hypothetical protein [Endozoicomonas arenosclerae]